MKKIKFVIFALICVIYIVNSNSQTDDPTTWKYFKILAKSDDDSLFINFQKDIGVDPLLQSYTLYVDIRSSKPENQYFVIGKLSDPSSYKDNWNRLSESTRKGLISWTKSNKIKLE